MSILQEIQKWGSSLPGWQQDAIVRLFSKGALTEVDDADVYALLKAAHGVADPDNRVATKLDAAQIAPPADPSTLIQLLAVRNVKNVNALAENQTLRLAPVGLTVVYGDNGAGKSGYSRALKKACRARDQTEVILPNAKATSSMPGKAQADFEVSVNGAPSVTLGWTDGSIAPTELSSIAIFDAHCARSYLDAQGDSWYSPYGLDILSGLAALCVRLNGKASKEIEEGRPNLVPFSHLIEQKTDVGKLLSALSANTKTADVTKLATIIDVDREQHAQIGTSLKENNPKEKADSLRLRAGLLEGLADRCDEKALIVSDLAAKNLKDLVNASNAARDVAALAAKVFHESPGQLAGTGGELWQQLFEAARKYSVESHPHKHFPDLGPDAQCPLCQQPLEEGAARLLAFEAFINNDVERTFREKRDAARSAYEAVVKADLSIGLEASLRNELKQIKEELATACVDFSTSLAPRVAAIKKACGKDGDWKEIGDEPKSPAAELRSLATSFRTEAATLEATLDPKARTDLEAKHAELDARIKLEPLKPAVLDAIDKMILQAKLTKCIAAVRTTAISNKATELSEKVVTQDLAAALNDEFKHLDAGGLHVTLKSSTTRGKTLFKLALELPGQQRPASVLSEGEQRAIAIGSFLAEVNISGMSGGIVFDDPVSSLDHKRRWKVATRLVEEGKKRQVIIFTHDLYFLCGLQQEAEKGVVPIQALALRKTSDGFGVATEKLPFDGTPCSKRTKALKAMHQEVAALHKKGDEDAAADLIRDAYFQLRLTWERAVEEVLLFGVVERFSEGISTQRLRDVEVRDADYSAVDAGMTKCSKYAHDGASKGHVSPPSPDELLADIDGFDKWRLDVIAQQKATKERRKS